MDLETTCYEFGFPEGESKEIIQIGACLLDLGRDEIKNKKSYIVRPYDSKISEYCSQLTGITWDTAKFGMRFDHARNKMCKDFGTKSKVWAAWGEGDRLEFEKACVRWNIEYPFSDEFLNINTLFSMKYKVKSRINLKRALEMCDLKFEGQPHRADDDAFNTARILREILK